MITPIQLACRHQHSDLTNCGAEAGEPCHNRFGDRDPAFFHAERIMDAAGISDGAGSIEIPNSIIEKAAEDLGIV